MPRRKDAYNLGLQLTPEQTAALTKAAVVANMTLAAYVRKILVENVPGFTNEIQKRERGKGQGDV